jgi:hypothetical protein
VSVNHSSFALLRACLLVLAAVVFAGAASAEPAKPEDAAVTAAPAAPQMTPADVEAFLDGLVPFEIESADIAGMTIAIVKDGKLLFAKGYGFSDAEKVAAKPAPEKSDAKAAAKKPAKPAAKPESKPVAAKLPVPKKPLPKPVVKKAAAKPQAKVIAKKKPR